MKHVRTAIWIHVVSTVLVLSAEQASGRDRVRLWYDEPASKWTEAMPLGNGRLGAMVFGTVPKERLQGDDVRPFRRKSVILPWVCPGATKLLRPNVEHVG